MPQIASNVPPLFAHQRDAVEFLLARREGGALFHEIGLGKTRTILEYYARLKKERASSLKLLVVAPLSLLEAAWGADIQKFTSFSYYNLHKHIDKPCWQDIILINYESFITPKKLAWIKAFSTKYPTMIACDESSRMKNHRSITVKRLMELRSLFISRVVASGTPAPNTELEYWAQLEFVAPGILYSNYFKFQNTLFHLAINGKALGFQPGGFMTRDAMAKLRARGAKYMLSDANRHKLTTLLAPACHWRKKRECLDLPPMTDEYRDVELSPEQRKAYEDMRKHMVAEIIKEAGDTSKIMVQNALSKLMKLRQITGGFAFDTTGAAVPFKANPKLSELIDLIEEIGDQPILIWAQFRWEIATIEAALKAKYGEVVDTLYSLTPNREISIQNYLSGKSRFLVAHPESAAHGLTFVHCAVEIFYALDYSAENYIQAKGRIDRPGQKRAGTYFHLIAKNSIDELLLGVVQKKIASQEIVYQLVRETTKGK